MGRSVNTVGAVNLARGLRRHRFTIITFGKTFAHQVGPKTPEGREAAQAHGHQRLAAFGTGITFTSASAFLGCFGHVAMNPRSIRLATA